MLVTIFLFLSLTPLAKVECVRHVPFRNTYIHSCCSTQFAFQPARNDCYNWEDYMDVIPFPRTLFQTFKFAVKRLDCNETDRLFFSISKLKKNIYESGHLEYEGELYTRDEYCIDSIGEKAAEVVVNIKSKCQQIRTGIPKCCNENELFDLGRGHCYPSDLPTFSSEQHRRSEGRPHLPGTKLNCSQLKNFTSIRCWHNPIRFEVGFDGGGKPILKYETVRGVFVRGKWKALQEPYCVERISNYKSTCRGEESQDAEIVFYCADEEDIPAQFYALMIGCLWIGTSILLSITAVLNVTRVQTNSHGWVLFCYLITSSLLNLVAGIFIMVADETKSGCNFLDFATRFLYSSTLCWMTMVNFDLWWTFRRFKNVKNESISKWLPYYCLFAWTIPTIITAVCWFIGQSQISETKKHCILYDHALILYSSGPIVFLIIVNLCLFLRTALTIQGIRNSTRIARMESRVHRESFRLFSKLFLMSGPIWTLRVILHALQFQGNYLTWYGVLIEIIFSLPDIAFFLLVVLHPKVIPVVKLPCLRRVSIWFHESSMAGRNSFSLHDHSSLRRRNELQIVRRESILGIKGIRQQNTLHPLWATSI